MLHVVTMATFRTLLFYSFYFISLILFRLLLIGHMVLSTILYFRATYRTFYQLNSGPRRDGQER